MKRIREKRARKEWMRDHGYDGLINDDIGCECCLSDFEHCGDEPGPDCVPARRTPGGELEVD